MQLLKSTVDRKTKFTEDQIDKYFEFKEMIVSKVGQELANKFSDNVYCRYLTGYVWDLKVAETNMLGMIVIDFVNLFKN